MLVLYVGLGSAQFLLMLSNPQTAVPFMLVSALISLAMVPIVASAQQTPEPALPQQVRFATCIAIRRSPSWRWRCRE